jgi:RNA polymerase sigma-70 factor, ECF subfamily
MGAAADDISGRMSDGSAGNAEPLSFSRPGLGSDGASSAKVALSVDRFGQLFGSHTGTFWCVAAGVLGDRSRAHDVVQEAAVVALTKIAEFDAAPSGMPASFIAWMSQIVRFVALNDGRKRQREREHAERIAADARHSGAQETEAVQPGTGGFDALVERALGALDPTARACVILRTVRGMSYNEIAAVLGIPEGTAMSHVCRARRELRERLDSRNPYRGRASEAAGGEGAR